LSEPLTGGCLCGAVRYEVDAPVTRLVACYCADCRKATSAGGSVSAVIPASAFRITRGRTRVFTKTADSGAPIDRHFCGDCGSWIYNPLGGDPDRIVLKAGGLDRQEGMSIGLNVWAGSRPAWAPMEAEARTREGR